MQFWYILIAKYGYDEEGNRLEYTEEQLEEVKKRATDTYERALETEDFYSLAREVSDDNDIEIIVALIDLISKKIVFINAFYSFFTKSIILHILLCKLC